MTPVDKLLSVTDASTDNAVASLIADKLVYYAASEWYRFRINHDISPPKCLACPLPYDWTMKGFVGIETTNKAHARQWLTDAALAGYKIEEVDAKRKPKLARSPSPGGSGLLPWPRIASIHTVRKHAQLYQMYRSDDDIPF